MRTLTAPRTGLYKSLSIVQSDCDQHVDAELLHHVIHKLVPAARLREGLPLP